ncbi:MAG: hypothetical protein WA323_07865, partial [Candidatus Nitrosopolaris sp.]
MIKRRMRYERMNSGFSEIIVCVQSIKSSCVYHASATSIESGPPPQLIISTVKVVVDQQQYFFDMLWKKAIPAKQRIKEIEQGLKREFMETIRDPYETQKILDNLIKPANEEIMITLPSKTTTTNMRPY